MSLLEEKKHELDDLKQQADISLSRPTTSTKERKPFDSLENNTSNFNLFNIERFLLNNMTNLKRLFYMVSI
jgi:hypothetical protein